MSNTRVQASYLRTFVFGVEDSLVSTIGLISGVAAAGVTRGTILTTGIILVFVEAFSMAVGSFLSEESAEQFLHGGNANSDHGPAAGFIMFVSYFVSGFIPLFPYAIWNVDVAFWIAIGSSIIALFILGLISGYLTNTSKIRSGIKMSVFGGIAIALGVIIGYFMQRGLQLS